MAILTTLAGLSAAYTRIEARVVVIARRFDLISEDVAAMTPTTTVAVTASTTQTQAAGIALALTQDYINVSVCANSNDTIALPAAVVGATVTVTNSGAQTLRIYPYTSDNLGAGVDTFTTLAAGASAQWWAIDATTWKRIV